MTEADLYKLKEEIEKAKTAIANYEGRKQALLNQLKNDFGCTDIETARLKLKDMNEEFNKISNDIASNIIEIEKKYDSK